MQKRVLTSAIALALTALAAGTASAQSSVTIYGNIDVGFDHVKRTAGDQTSLLKGTKLSTARVTPDLSSQSSLGFRGTEDLGGGYKGNFVLEGQMGGDTGALGRDGRMFGRQMYVGLTSPFGEIRLGRQYAPIFFSSALVTSERFGATDLYLDGGLSNSLNIRWDNAITYSAQVGAFRGQVGFSPNAGVAKISNSNRGATANDATGEIVGGINAGGENTDGRGRSFGLFGAYTGDALTLTAGYGHTNFDASAVNAGNAASLDKGISAGSLVGNLDTYKVFNLGAKYEFKDLGLQFNGAFGRAEYDFASLGAIGTAFGLQKDTSMSMLVVGTRYTIGSVALLAQWSEIKFRNGPRGKDHGYVLGAEYSLSKRTTLYSRYFLIRDKDGGPDAVMAATGLREVPTGGAANVNPDGKLTMWAVGIRHNF